MNTIEVKMYWTRDNYNVFRTYVHLMLCEEILYLFHSLQK
jgi:hypothetical protein